MIQEQKVLEVSGISKKFHRTPENKAISRIGWHSLIESLFKPSKKTQKYEYFDALSRVSFSLSRGESLGIIGLNGSGKSTLLSIISGTMEPTQGFVRLNGKVVALLELGSGFSPEFTGIENIKLSASLHGLTKDEIDIKLDSIIEFADIGDFIYQPVKTYSTGMLLRLAFSVSIHVDADTLIIDEALAVGDARFQIKCFTFLEELKSKGKSLVLVSHDLNSVARLCTKSILLHKGELKVWGNPIDVINEYSKVLHVKDLDFSTPENIQQNNKIKQIENPPKKVLDSNRKALLKAEQSGFPMSNNEFTYGSLKAEICDIQVFDEKGLQSTVLESGINFSVAFRARAKRKITKPIYAMVIRDTKGQQIYGQNTYFAKISTDDLEVGSEIEVTFRQCLNLGSGDYLISLGLTRFENDQLQVIHRRYDAIKIKVVNFDGSIGIANCFSSIDFNLESENTA
jgi:ABC-type polysaccharide/polyol phosphate transport system ATPase subunit